MLFRFSRPPVFFRAALFLTVAVFSAPWASAAPPRLLTEIREESDGPGTERVLRVTAHPLRGSSWVLERSLSLGAAGGQWFPFAQGEDSYYRVGAPSAGDDQPWYSTEFPVLTLPALPFPPPVSMSGAGSVPRRNYLQCQVGLRLHLDGRTEARWLSVNDGVTPVQAVFTPGADFDLRDPTGDWPEPNRPVLGIGLTHHAGSPELPPVMLGYWASEWPAGTTWPSPPALTGSDLTVRAALRFLSAEIRADLWPGMGEPGPPPPPPTLNERGFYRLREDPPLHDVGGNGIPDELAAARTDLMISEVCYAPLEAPDFGFSLEFTNAAEQLAPAFPSGPPDWVELINASSSAKSTAACYLSDDSGNRKKGVLPSLTLQPGQRLLVLCANEAHPEFAARVAAGSSLKTQRMPLDLKDNGETLFLSRDTNGNGIIDSAANERIDSMEPPFFGPPALTGLTAGRTPRRYAPRDTNGDGVPDTTDPPAWATVFLAKTSPGELNSGVGSTRLLAPPLVWQTPAGGGSAEPARSGLFRNIAAAPRLSFTHVDSSASVVYTLDGSEPGPEDTLYTGPITLHGSAMVRARAVAPGAVPSPVVTRTYLSTPEVLSQFYPQTLPRVAASSYLFPDPAVACAYAFNVPPDRAGYPAAGTLLDQLEARPSVFLTVDPQGAVYPDGDPETLASFEWHNPARPQDYRQENAFLQETGGSSTAITAKKSYDILFKDKATFGGTHGWQGAEQSAGVSSVFPGSPVSAFRRLLLRNPAQASFPYIKSSHKVYISDAWLKETQRALGGLTCQRRWVHVFINTAYWGVYDLEEHLDAHMVSSHLRAALPGGTSHPNYALCAPENILFGQPDKVPDFTALAYAPPAFTAAGGTVESHWWNNTATVLANAAGKAAYDEQTAAVALGRAVNPAAWAAQWNALTAKLDIPSYIDYMTTMQTAEHADTSNPANARVWRHPVDGKWRVMAWDGDYVSWAFNGAAVPHFINGNDPAFNLTTTAWAPQKALNQHPDYFALFGPRLRAHLAGPLSPADLTERFDALAADFRRTLECEALRWPYSENEDPPRDALSLWEMQMIHIRELITSTSTDPDANYTYNTLVKGGKLAGYLDAFFPYLPTP